MKTRLPMIALALASCLTTPARAALDPGPCIACTVEAPTVLDDFRHFIRHELDVQMDSMRREVFFPIQRQFGIDRLDGLDGSTIDRGAVAGLARGHGG